MSGIEHLPSLLGNFPISEFGFRLVLRCLFLGLSPLDVLLFGVFVALCFFFFFPFVAFVAFAIVESFYFDYLLYFFSLV